MTQEIQCKDCGETREVNTNSSKEWYEKRSPLCRKCARPKNRLPHTEMRCEDCGEMRNVKTTTSKEHYEKLYPRCTKCARDKNRLTDIEAGRKRVHGAYKSKAQKAGREFDIRLDEFSAYIEGPCVYCGSVGGNALDLFGEGTDKYYYNGVDRIDNDKGYITGNCQSCCKHCNIAKRDRTHEEFLEWIRRAHEYNRRIYEKDNSI